MTKIVFMCILGAGMIAMLAGAEFNKKLLQGAGQAVVLACVLAWFLGVLQ
jgi:hypothetical protein